MTEAWTPGPWQFHPPFCGFSKITGPNGELIFGIAAGSAEEKRPDDVCEANARLIATAPGTGTMAPMGDYPAMSASTGVVSGSRSTPKMAGTGGPR